MAKAPTNSTAFAWVDPDAWPDLDLHWLYSERRVVPTLPMHQVFPPATANWIEMAAESVGAPADYVAIGLLGAMAGICGAGVMAEATPQWREPLVLWVAPIGAPSTGKTPALSVARYLIETIESEARSGDDERRREHQAREASAKLAHAGWLEDVEAALEKGLPAPLPPVDAEPPAPFMTTQMLIGDATLESIADVVAANARGVVSWHDELAGWLQSFNRYSSGSNRPAWLEGWSAGPVRINRKSRSEALVLRKLPLSVVGTIQPDRLREALTGADDGLPARFLYTWPDSPGFKSLADRRAPQSEGMLQRLRRIAASVGTADEPLTVQLSPAAFSLFDEFSREHHTDAADHMGLASGWFGKGPGTVLRLAGVLHLLLEAESDGQIGTMISPDTFRAAAGLWADYFLPHAMAAFSVAGLSEKERRLRRTVEWMQRHRSAEITGRQMHQETFARTLSTEEVAEVAKHLEKAGVIRAGKRAPAVGRPSSVWTVNPAIHMGVQSGA
jgi:hypothetical protein